MHPRSARASIVTPGKKRPGWILAAVLVVVALTGAMTTHLTRKMISEFQANRARRDDLQCQLLAVTGLDRAVAQLEHDPSYRGETWSVPAVELSTSHAGRIEISVTRQGEPMRVTAISVKAVFPADGPRPITVRRSWPGTGIPTAETTFKRGS